MTTRVEQLFLPSTLVYAGADLITIARNLGHADVNASLVYIDDEETARALDTEKLFSPR